MLNTQFSKKYCEILHLALLVKKAKKGKLNVCHFFKKKELYIQKAVKFVKKIFFQLYS